MSAINGGKKKKKKKHIEEELKRMMCPNNSRTPSHWEFGKFTADTAKAVSLEKLAASGNHPAASLVVVAELFQMITSIFIFNLLFFIKMLNKGKREGTTKAKQSLTKQRIH